MHPETYDNDSEEHATDGHESADHETVDHESGGHDTVDHDLVDHESGDHDTVDHESGDHESASFDDEGPTFASLGLRSEVLAVLDQLGYEEPTSIQAASIPELIAGNDLLGQAATGTGKTAAFALPLLEELDVNRDTVNPSALILVPTRELAIQVSEAIHKYGRRLDVRVVPIYGGQPIYRQFQQLERGVDIVVATPGRALDHIGRGSLPLEQIRTVVLDEADEMLDMGFADDLEAILSATPEDRQTVLFSATMPRRIASIAKRYQHDPVRITIDSHEIDTERALITQKGYVVQRRHKVAALARILDVESPSAAIVFCRTRGEVDQVAATMNGRGYRAEALHGGMDQQQRDRVMDRLRKGSADLLIATDVAARGIDVDTLTHVVNFDVPSAAESYVHRIGRVGRAGREGTAITLAEPREQRQLSNIERHTGQSISLEAVPTVEDLRGQRLERLRESINDVVERRADDLADDTLGPVIDDLADMYGIREVALAALQLAYEAAGAEADEPDIPDARRSEGGKRFDRGGDRGRDRDQRRPGGTFEDRARENAEPTGFLYVSLGREAGVRPGDLVGAIANEVNLSGQQIGPIRVSDHYSVVGIPERTVDQAIGVLDGAAIRGQQVKVRRFTDDGRSEGRGPGRGKPRGSNGPSGRGGPRRDGPDRGGPDRRGSDRGGPDRGGSRGGPNRAGGRGGPSRNKSGRSGPNRGGPPKGDRGRGR